MLVDTHAHLQWASFDRDREKVVDRAQKADVKYIVNIGFDLDGSREAVKLAEKHDGLYATVGIHPHNASQLNENIMDELRKLSGNRKVVAIGEIGLDYYRNLSPKEAQRKAFEAQLLLAEELELPVVIHNREAHAETLEMLLEFEGRITGVMHCFSGSREMAQQCIKLGFYISFAGPVTFPNSHKLHEIVKWINLNKVLLETDSPWLAYIVRRIATLKETPVDKLAEATTKNAKQIFQLP